MRDVTFWQRLINLFSRSPARDDVVIRPNPALGREARYRLAVYEIPMNENYGDC